MAHRSSIVRGEDVVAAAARLGEGVQERARDLLGADVALADEEALGRLMPPAALHISPGAWAAVFSPLFGEFE